MGQIDHDTLQALIESGDAERAAPPEADITIPEGAVRFDVTAENIRDALAEDSGEIENVDDMDVPEVLITDAQLDALVAERRPQFVPVAEGAATHCRTEQTAAATQVLSRNGHARMHTVHNTLIRHKHACGHQSDDVTNTCSS